MIDARCVPWPKPSTWAVAGSWLSNDRSGPLTTFPLVSPGTGDTPLSISATSTPLPVYPACQATLARTIRLMLYRDPVSVAGVKAPAGAGLIGTPPPTPPPTAAAQAVEGARAASAVRAPTTAGIARRCHDLPRTAGAGRRVPDMALHSSVRGAGLTADSLHRAPEGR